MDIYHVHPDTGEYLFSGVADPSPLEPGHYLIPAHAMTTPPPDTALNEAAVAIDGVWQVVPDHRGTVYFMPDGSRHEITEIGVELPANSSLTPPPPSLAELKAAKIADLSASFLAAVASGFVVANGWRMDADINDVQHLKSAYDLAVLAGTSALPVVVDYDNIPHTDVALADVLDIIVELGTNYQTLYQKRATLRKAATDASATDLDDIVW